MQYIVKKNTLLFILILLLSIKANSIVKIGEKPRIFLDEEEYQDQENGQSDEKIEIDLTNDDNDIRLA
jgi:hypothetical protein